MTIRHWKVISFCFFFVLTVSLMGGSATPAALVTISGTVEVGDDPVPGARVSALDVDDNPIANDTSDVEGKFSFEVPEDSKVQLLLQGPTGSEDYVDTYYPFLGIWYLPPEDLQDVNLPILWAPGTEPVLQTLDLIDVSKGVGGGRVVEEVPDSVAGDDLIGLSGVRISFVEHSTGEPVDAVIVYQDEDGDWNQALTETSSEGRFIIYNIEIPEGADHRDLSIIPQKEGYDLERWPHVRVYRYRVAERVDRVTLAPFKGSQLGGGGASPSPDGGHHHHG